MCSKTVMTITKDKIYIFKIYTHTHYDYIRIIVLVLITNLYTSHLPVHIAFVNISINKSGFVCMYKEPLHNINDVPKINNHGDHRFSK